jgi:CRP-like cAMP-binding protein
VLAPLAVAATWPALRRLDGRMRVRDADIEVLRSVQMLGALPVPTIEQLGGDLEHAAFAPRATVFQQGDPGERFYVVESGRAEVVRDGRLVRTLGRGECFGEIALLHDAPRTATVLARTEMELCVINRPTFLRAVSGYRSAAAEADAVATARLETFTPAAT